MPVPSANDNRMSVHPALAIDQCGRSQSTRGVKRAGCEPLTTLSPVAGEQVFHGCKAPPKSSTRNFETWACQPNNTTQIGHNRVTQVRSHHQTPSPPTRNAQQSLSSTISVYAIRLPLATSVCTVNLPLRHPISLAPLTGAPPKFREG